METNDNKLHFDSITQLVNHYESEALSIDLRDKFPLAYNVVESQKLKAKEVQSEAELQQVKDFCIKAVAKIKHKLSMAIINENYKVKSNYIQPFVFDIRLLLEYNDVMQTLSKLSITVQSQQPIDKILEIINFPYEVVHAENGCVLKSSFLELIIFNDEDKFCYDTLLFIIEPFKELEAFTYNMLKESNSDIIKNGLLNKIKNELTELITTFIGAREIINDKNITTNPDLRIVHFIENYCSYLCIYYNSILNYLNINNDLFQFDNESFKYFLNTSEPLQIETVIREADEVFKFENNFDKVDELKVYNFFKNELVDKKYLKKEDLQTFLLIAFQDKKIPNTKFNFGKKFSIQAIRKIFYRYFSEINTDKYKTQDKYIKLLTDYFEGFEYAKIKNNFNK